MMLPITWHTMSFGMFEEIANWFTDLLLLHDQAQDDSGIVCEQLWDIFVSD